MASPTDLRGARIVAMHPRRLRSPLRDDTAEFIRELRARARWRERRDLQNHRERVRLCAPRDGDARPGGWTSWAASRTTPARSCCRCPSRRRATSRRRPALPRAGRRPHRRLSDPRVPRRERGDVHVRDGRPAVADLRRRARVVREGSKDTVGGVRRRDCARAGQGEGARVSGPKRRDVRAVVGARGRACRRPPPSRWRPCRALAVLANVPFDGVEGGAELAALCRLCENAVAGAPCGVMDRMTASLGEESRLLALLCSTNTVLGHVRMPRGCKLWGIDSGVRHSNDGESDYGRVRCAAFMFREHVRRTWPERSCAPRGAGPPVVGGDVGQRGRCRVVSAARTSS